jgi:putative redox protein
VATLDGTGGSGQSPVDALLSALAACAGIDVVEILAKRRTPVESFEIEMTGERVDTVPRRYKAIMMTFRMRGAGIEREQAERAVDLSLNKYCSVRASLASDIQIEWKLELEA